MIPFMLLLADAILIMLVDTLMKPSPLRTGIYAWLFALGFVFLMGVTEELTDWERDHPPVTLERYDG